jgi:hypothetical protein
MSWHQGSQKVSSGATAAVEMGVTPGGSGVRWVWVMQGAGESRLEVFQSRSTPLLGQGMSPRRWLGGLGGWGAAGCQIWVTPVVQRQGRWGSLSFF